MNGHVEGPLVRGQRVRVVLLGTVERSPEGWELYCGGETVALDSEAIVNIQFIDEQETVPLPVIVPCHATGSDWLCTRGAGHPGQHQDENEHVMWP
jgi:hypothetical protein